MLCVPGAQADVEASGTFSNSGFGKQKKVYGKARMTIVAAQRAVAQQRQHCVCKRFPPRPAQVRTAAVVAGE